MKKTNKTNGLDFLYSKKFNGVPAIVKSVETFDWCSTDALGQTRYPVHVALWFRGDTMVHREVISLRLLRAVTAKELYAAAENVVSGIQVTEGMKVCDFIFAVEMGLKDMLNVPAAA